VRSEVVIDADWIAAHLDDPDVRVVEVDVSSAAYDRGHVAGAILRNAYQDLRHPDYTPITPDDSTAFCPERG
jgi:thiosulfate/3-mercaptopyruvate sulfurtransferase